MGGTGLMLTGVAWVPPCSPKMAPSATAVVPSEPTGGGFVLACVAACWRLLASAALTAGSMAFPVAGGGGLLVPVVEEPPQAATSKSPTTIPS